MLFLKQQLAARGISRCLLVSFFLVSASLITACGDRIERITIVEENCGNCHPTDPVYRMKRTKAEWDRIVYGMKMRGLQISEADENKLMQELYNKLGK